MKSSYIVFALRSKSITSFIHSAWWSLLKHLISSTALIQGSMTETLLFWPLAVKRPVKTFSDFNNFTEIRKIYNSRPTNKIYQCWLQSASKWMQTSYHPIFPRFLYFAISLKFELVSEITSVKFHDYFLSQKYVLFIRISSIRLLKVDFRKMQHFVKYKLILVY